MLNKILVGRHSPSLFQLVHQPGNGQSPILQFVRHRTRTPNLKKPAVPHFQKALVLDLIKVKYKHPLDGLPPTQTCVKAVKAAKSSVTKDNPFVRILAREFYEKIDSSGLFAVMHRHPCSTAELFDMRVTLFKKNMEYLYHGNQIVSAALRGTKYEPVLKLYECTCATVVSPEADISQLLKLQKKLPYFTLLGAVVNGRLMSVAELQYYSSLPSLPSMHAQLVSTLNAHAATLSRHLTHHQRELATSLQQLASGESAECGSSNSEA